MGCQDCGYCCLCSCLLLTLYIFGPVCFYSHLSTQLIQLKQQKKVQLQDPSIPKKSRLKDTDFRLMVHSQHSSEENPRKENIAEDRAGQNGKKLNFTIYMTKIPQFCADILRIVGMVVLGACKNINTIRFL